MNKENEIEYLVALYGISYFTLYDRKMLGEGAVPLKLRKKDNTEKNQDIISIYKWLAEKIKGLSKQQLKDRAKKFNSTVEALEDNFFLNQYLMGLFMLEAYLTNQSSVFDKNMILPKVERLIKKMRKGIMELKHANNVDGKEIVLDSSKAASNIWRMFNNKAQLTKEVRAARRRMWAEAARNKPKTLSDIYNID